MTSKELKIHSRNQVAMAKAQRHYDNQEEPPEQCRHRWVHIACMDGINFFECSKCGEEFER